LSGEGVGCKWEKAENTNRKGIVSVSPWIDGRTQVATIEKAIQIAARAHEGQRDKEGLPYILHSLRVMMSVEGEEAQMVAVLHDVIEDTTVTADDLREAGFGEEVIAAVLCVTHRKDQPYADYVVGCKGNEIARKVKLADLEDNSRLARTILRPQRLRGDLARIRRYVLSYKFLTDQITEEEYRQLMEEDH
jgi:(p)ppGpp synthase/HD superfamily hydrolase